LGYVHDVGELASVVEVVEDLQTAEKVVPP
jgi:hypothetical protein